MLVHQDHAVGDAVAGAPLDSAGRPTLRFHGTTMNCSAGGFVIAPMPETRTDNHVECPGSGESSMPTQPLTIEGLIDGFTAASLTAIEPMVEQTVAMNPTAVAPGSIHLLALDLVVDIAALFPRSRGVADIV